MDRSVCIILFVFFFGLSAISQNTEVKGRILDADSNEPIPDVEVAIQESDLRVQTNADGVFQISGKRIPEGEQILIIFREGYLTQKIPVTIYAAQINELTTILLSDDMTSIETEMGIISLSEDQLNEEAGATYNVSGFLQASKDVFLNAAAFDFSATFFRPRGYDSKSGKLLINGLEMNKLYDGSPQWTNWGGLNDVQRNQVFSMGLSPNDFTFGDLAGTTNIIMRASQYRNGGRISYAIGNQSYRGRVMGSYNSGLLKNGWAYSVLLSRRFASEGFIEGTPYDANSLFISVEKKVSDRHSINFTAFYTPNRKGKSAAITQEVYDLKGRQYNSYWGKQDGEIRNSRIRKVEEPVFMLNHFWNISENTVLNTNVGYQFGHISNSRLGYDNAPNPDPAYYKKLPSYFLGNPNGVDYEGAYRAYDSFVNDGQIDWVDLYETNIFYGGTSRYYLYEDRNDDSQLMANSTLNTQLGDRLLLTAAVNFKSLESHNYAKMLDLLGGRGYLDIDVFNVGDNAQSDLNNPDRVVDANDVFKYNYKIEATQYDGFVQGQFSAAALDVYLAARVEKTIYQRNGLYRNGSYPDDTDSFGKSEALDFTTFGVKAGFTYKISGRHGVNVNSAYFTKAPNVRNSFSNSRQNNNTVIDLVEETIVNIDASYLYRTPFIKARLTGYYTQLQDATEISFFYADGISVQGRSATTAFIQEVLTDVDQTHIGGELGVEAQVTPTIKLKGAAAYGQHVYDNNPELYITSDDFVDPQFFGKSLLKNYKVAGGPQQAYQLGFEYRDPNFWWMGVSANHFSNAYLNISPLARTKNFYLDSDGIPFIDYDPEIARALLKQEKFDSYMLVNVVGGKSWRIKKYNIGFFAAINNVLDKQFKTGGFEQGRNANYKTLLEDASKDTRVFGPKYWYGYGTTFYLNLYVRF